MIRKFYYFSRQDMGGYPDIFIQEQLKQAILNLQKPKIMATRAKFTCNEVSKRTGWGANKIVYAAKFSVVTGDSEENKSFWAATPAGSIEVSTVKEDHFEVGKTYFVDFTEAP